jgi:hypothetical protein
MHNESRTAVPILIYFRLYINIDELYICSAL